MATQSPRRKSTRSGAEDAKAAAAEGARFLPELLRRGLTLGFTGIFVTEEAIRRALGDSVPRDMLEFMVEQTERTRNEFLDRLSREFGRALNRLDPVEIAKRLLEGRSIEVTAEFRLVPKERMRRRTGRAEGEEESGK
jgi:hypothetical protein